MERKRTGNRDGARYCLWIWLAPLCLTVMVGLCGTVSLVFDAHMLKVQKKLESVRQLQAGYIKANAVRRVALQRLTAPWVIEKAAVERLGMIYPQSRIPLFPEEPVRQLERESVMAQNRSRPGGLYQY